MLTTRWFHADEMDDLVSQVNAFLSTVPRHKIRDLQYGPGKVFQVGDNMVFGAYVVYEVP